MARLAAPAGVHCCFGLTYYHDVCFNPIFECRAIRANRIRKARTMTTEAAPYAVTRAEDGDSWEPFINAQGEQAGEVIWLRDTMVGDRPLRVGIWRVLPGQLPTEVPRLFPGHETIHVLEGAVTIAVVGDEPRYLTTGDMAHYAEGIHSTWTFTMPFKKLFVIS